MKFRVTVVAVIGNDKGEVFLCRQSEKQGLFPGKWSLPGGGIEEGERMEEALHREVWEETGLKIDEIKPLLFSDDQRVKKYTDGTSEKLYMIYLLFTCRAISNKVKLNEEMSEFAWVKKTKLDEYDLNEPTRETFKDMGLL